jgi:hypothetical protein
MPGRLYSISWYLASSVAEFSRGFANPFQAAFDGILGLGISDELLCGYTPHVGTDARDVIEDIAQASLGVARRHGFRLGEHRGQREVWVYLAGRDVDSLEKEFLDFGYDPCIVQQVYGSLSVEVEQQINVAVTMLGPTCGGTEQREMFDAELLEARRGGTEEYGGLRGFFESWRW